MNKDLLQRFGALVRLRYKLIWAHARTGSGKIAILFGIYLLGGFFALVFALGGTGLGFAITTIDPERAEYFTRWILTGLFVNGVGLSLLFGVGPRAAFSENALRRFPLNARERFLIRQLIGILDPIWLLLIASTLGLGVGFLWLGGGSFLQTFPAVIVFIVANYLATVVLLNIVGWVMETRRGASILGTVVLLLVSFGPLAIALLVNNHKAVVWDVLNQLMRFTPPGAAAAMIAGNTAAHVLSNFILLLLWCLVLVWALEKLEARPAASAQSAAGRVDWQDYVDQIANVFGAKYAPLVSKSLRYHLRCNMIRFSLLTAPIIIVAFKYMVPARGKGQEVAIPLAMFFVASSATAAAMMLNAFGYDDAGIRRYAVLPIQFVDALRAMNLTSLLLRTIVVFISLALWLIVYSNQQMPWQMPAMVVATAVSSLFFYNGLGFWTSVYSPKTMDFDAMWNNRLSFGANIVLIAGMMIPFWVIMTLAQRLGTEAFLKLWWVAALLMIACVAFYLFSFYRIEDALKSRRERLINLLAGARG